MGSQGFQAYDLFRTVGREFELVTAVLRLICGGVLDEFPRLNIIMSHFGGGITSLVGRIRDYQDKEFWGTSDNARHGMKARRDFDYYLQHNMVFDTAGFCGAIGAVKGALIEIPASRIVFAADRGKHRRVAEFAFRRVAVDETVLQLWDVRRHVPHEQRF